jgi:hypothetical protein
VIQNHQQRPILQTIIFQTPTEQIINIHIQELTHPGKLPVLEALIIPELKLNPVLLTKFKLIRFF